MYAPESYQEYIRNIFYATFPTSDIKIHPQKSLKKHPSNLKFSHDSVFYETHEFMKWWEYVDPFKDVLSLFWSIPQEWTLSLLYSCQFKVKKTFFQKCLALRKKFFSNDKSEKNTNDKEEVSQQENVKKVWKDVIFALQYFLHLDPQWYINKVNTDINHVFDKFLQQGTVKPSQSIHWVSTNLDAFINLFHIPTKSFLNNTLHYIPYRKLEHPVNLPMLSNTSSDDLTILWKTEYKNQWIEFGIKTEDKFRHVYIVWKTWMWKSTFISNMVRSDMQTNHWLAVIDPHGDLIDDVLVHIPSHRINDVVVFDVSDTAYPVWFNILEFNTPEEKTLVASAVVSIFKKLFAHSRWPRLEYILRNVMLSVLDYPNTTLMHVMRMLNDKKFREEVLTHVSDPVVMKFWRDEYDKRQPRQVQEAVWPIANKIWQFLSSPVVRNIFAQPKSSLQLRKIMDEGKILLINLSKWKIWEDNASMLWSFLVSKFQIDAMSRADVDYNMRKDFYLYIDEFQNFATDSFESILSEARKYRLSLIVANQYTSQIQENVRNAIFGNVGTIVSFGLWYDDAMLMSQQFKELISPNDLLSLPKFKAYVKLMVDWVTTDPFTMGTFPLPLPESWPEIKEKILKQSRQRYATEREKLESLLQARMEKQFTESEKVIEKVQQETLKQDGTTFSIDDLKVWERYDWYVKLKYNYWLFVTVKGVEWLLHKSLVKVPDTLSSWKDLYVIWDKISVKVDWFKEIEWEKKIVWTQKD